MPYTDRLSNEPVNKDYDSYTLENEHVKVVLLPELGGKIHGAVDKHNNYEFIYQNTVIKPAMVGIAGPWVSGGVEFNWPQHHRPTTFMPLEATPKKNADGSVTVWMGEAEPFHRDARHGGHHRVSRPLLCGSQGCGLQPHRFSSALHVVEQSGRAGSSPVQGHFPAGCGLRQRP